MSSSHGTTFSEPYEFRRLAVQILNTKIEVKLLAGTIENFTNAMSTPSATKFLCGKGVVTSMRNSAWRRHFGFAKIALCA